MRSLYEELARINSNLINRVRRLFKDKTENASELYVEISKINNEQTNTRRMLLKKMVSLNPSTKTRRIIHKDPLTGLFNRRYFFIRH